MRATFLLKRIAGDSLRFVTLLPALLCGVAVLFIVIPAYAAPAARSPTLIDHIGDSIPLTMYMRLERQTQKTFLFNWYAAGKGDAQLEEGEVAVNNEGNVVVEHGTKTQLPDEWNVEELGNDDELPALGATTGKHRNQIIRNLPPSFSPRFGINRAVRLMANATLRAAGAELQRDPALQQSALAVRFSVGRGLQKESTWLPLASRHRVVSLLSALLGHRLDELRVAAPKMGAAEKAERAALEHEFEDVTAEKRAVPPVHYLSRVTFYFGYQTGEQHRLTSFSIDVRYSSVQRPGIDLHYIWDEHRPYNPNRALVLCSAASLLVTMMMVVVVFHPSSRSMLLFSQRIVAVREHE